MLKTKKEVIEWLNEKNITKYKINSDLTVDVNGYVDLEDHDLIEIPIQFNKVTSYFNCGSNKLTSLKGCPKVVESSFYCSNNNLSSLEYSPQKIMGGFDCSHNQLTSLIGSPQEIAESFYANNNLLKTLEGCPKSIFRRFYCENNNLESLDFLPEKIGMAIYLNNNPLLGIVQDIINLNVLKITAMKFNLNKDLNNYLEEKKSKNDVSKIKI